MQGARNGPRMNEDLVGPRHWVAGGPLGYKHGMRDEEVKGAGKGYGKGRTTAPLERETKPRKKGGRDRSDPCKERKTVPGWMRM